MDALCLQFDHQSIRLSFVVYQNSTARSCSVRKRASVQPVATVQTVSLTPPHVKCGQFILMMLIYLSNTIKYLFSVEHQMSLVLLEGAS